MTGATQAMLRRGKTEEMEETEMKAKIQNFVSDGSLTIEEKVSLMKTQLNTEAKCLMEELLKQGYGKDEVSIITTTAATLLTVAG